MPMKKSTFILLAAIGLLLTSCGRESRRSAHRRSTLVGPDVSAYDIGFDGEVYICTGPYAKAYHLDSNCEGLDNCSGDIEKISIVKAENMGRRPCRHCVNSW